MNKKLKFSFLSRMVFFHLLFANLLAQDQITFENLHPNIKFEHLTIKDGLSNNIVYAILQDSKGFMWFGTGEGLNRYDGYMIKEYQHDPTDSTSISGNFIWFEGLYEDREGTLWIATNASGLNKFDKTSETFQQYRHHPDDSLSLSNDIVTAIFEDQAGTFWIGTDNGLNILDRTTGKFIRFKHDPDDSTSLRHNRIWEICETGEGDGRELWVATHFGLDKFDTSTQQFIHFIYDTLQTQVSGPRPAITFYNDRNRILWIGSAYGLSKLNLQTRKINHYRHDPLNTNSLNFPLITDIWQSPGSGGQVLWITTRRGLNRFDTITETFTHYTYDPLNPDGLNTNGVIVLYEDRNQGFWIGTINNGINKVKRRQFKHFEHDPDNANSLSGRQVRVIFEDHEGGIWIATNNGLDKFNQQTGEVTRHQFIIDRSEDKNLIEPETISAIAENKGGMLWLGNYAGGLIQFDPQNSEITRYQHDPADPHSLTSNDVGSLLIDSYGTIWAGTNNHVVSRLNPEDRLSGRFSHFKPEPNKQFDRKLYMGFALLEDSYDSLWIGSELEGLYSFNRKMERFTSYKHDQSNPASISSNVVNAIFESHSGGDTALWIGTDNGLNRFDRQSQKFTRYYNRQAGASNDIYSFAEDSHGNLWIQNKKGISKFDMRREIFTNLDIAEELPSIMFRSYASLKSRSGEIFFGGYYGMIRFHPDSIGNNRYIPPIVLTDFKVFNEAVTLDSSISEKNAITLAHNQNFFSFEFAALDYTNPEKNEYAYKLEGLDKNWIYSGNRRFANYTDVQPGQYVLRVKGTNSDGVWNEQGISLSVMIRPPWWRTGWAYVLYAVLIVLALYVLRKFELNRANLRNELKSKDFEARKLKELDELKSHFFANISHEFRTPLTLILGPIEKVLAAVDDREIRKNLNMVQKNARRLRRLIEQLLDLSKLEAGKMVLQARPENIIPLLRGLIQSFEFLAKQKRMSLFCRAPDEDIIAYIDREKFEKIIVNLLSNALKFSQEGGKIEVAVATISDLKDTVPEIQSGASLWENRKPEISDFVEITVKDTGTGIPADRLAHIFDRFYRVDNSVVRAQEGTGIGLALTKELVELHQGSISVESEVGKGTIFMVQLPLGKAHLGISDFGMQISDLREKDAITAPKLEPPDSMVKLKSSHDKSVIGDSEVWSGASLWENSKSEIILVVEDNPDMRAFIRGYLEKTYQIREAENGVEGFQQARKSLPDLIISDVMMPVMDGIQLCEKIKTDELTSHVPVILLTAKAGEADKIEGLETGADDYLTKPFDARELQVRIKNLIEQRRRLKERFQRKIIIQPGQIATSSWDEKFLQKGMIIVQADMNDPEFGVERFAEKMGMSRVQLHRKLSALAGFSASKFIRTLRLKRAAELLKQKSGNISEIAYEVGFNNIPYFNKCFREQFGQSPSEYIDKSSNL